MIDIKTYGTVMQWDKKFFEGRHTGRPSFVFLKQCSFTIRFLFFLSMLFCVPMIRIFPRNAWLCNDWKHINESGHIYSFSTYKLVIFCINQTLFHKFPLSLPMHSIPSFPCKFPNSVQLCIKFIEKFNELNV